MKTKILFTLLAIFIYSTCFLAYNLFIKNGESTYVCTKTTQAEDTGFDIKLDYKMIVNEEGAITSGTNTVSYIYENKEVYESSKQYYEQNPSETEDYEYNDSNYIISVISDDTNLSTKDDSGNIVEIWYKSYMSNMTDMGYTCSKK